MLQIKNIPVTPLQQNCRILYQQGGTSGVVIDPGGDAEKVSAALESAGIQDFEIWLTHSHFDHCGGVSILKEETGASLVGHREEEVFRQSVEQACQMYSIPSKGMKNCPNPDRFISGGEFLSCGSYEFKVLFTPGHSPGHVCFYCESEKVLIAGDTVFAGSIGRTDLPAGDHEQLLKSIQREILVLADDTAVLPGHGPDTSVGRERASNPFLTGL